MSFDLSNQYVSQSYQNLVQISGSVLVNGLGATINQLNITATGSFTTLGYQSFRNPDHPTLQFTQNSTSVPALTVFDTVQTASIQIKYTTGSKSTAIATSFNTASFASKIYAYESSSARLAAVSADWASADNTFGTSMTFITGSTATQLGVGEDGPYITTSYSTSGSNLFVIQNGDTAQILNVYANGDFKQTNTNTTAYLFNLSSSAYGGLPAAGIWAENAPDFSTGILVFDDTAGSDGIFNALITTDLNTTNFASILTKYDTTLTENPSIILLYSEPSVGKSSFLTLGDYGIEIQGFTTGSEYTLNMYNPSDKKLFLIQNDGHVILPQVSASFNYADDIAAASAGVPLGGLYHTSGSIKIRLT